ncbi:hypothetical protein [Capybara microvirus Cap3_SP_468]|nr:hypothetical protein [Capybara microvirus Cap3_SP_468]
MIKYLYIHYNKKGSFYGDPYADLIEPNIKVEQLKQSISVCSVDALKSVSEDDLYLLGTIDNVTAQVNVFDKPQFVLDLSSLVHQTLKQGEVKQDEQAV